jgi:hypothetical protein
MNEYKMVQAVRVKALDGYRLEIDFDDQMTGILDLRDFVSDGVVTEPLRDPAFFARVFIEMGTPTWPNGCDFDAMNAHMKLATAGLLKRIDAAA